MTDILAAATDRFCRRLRMAAALRSASQFAGRSAVVLAVALVVAHLLSRRDGAADGGLWDGGLRDGGLLDGWLSDGRPSDGGPFYAAGLQGQVLAWLHGVWPWLLLAVAAVLAGVVAWRRPIDRVAAYAHLEQRLGTDGLLLMVAERGAAAGEWRQVLAPMLKDAPSVMPKLRVARLAVRPLLAAGALFALQWLPQPDPLEPEGRHAGALAVERLAREVDEVCELATLEPELRAELQRDVRELERRLADEEAPDLWRAIDNLRARLEREQAIAAAEDGPSSSGDMGSAGDMGGGGQAPAGQQSRGARSGNGEQSGNGAQSGNGSPLADAEQLAAALDQLSAVDAGKTAAAGEVVRSLRAGLTPDQRLMLDRAQRPDGSYDASQLAAHGDQLEPLAAELAEQAKEQLARVSSEAAAASALQQLADLGRAEAGAPGAENAAPDSPAAGRSPEEGAAAAAPEAVHPEAVDSEVAKALADDVLQGAADLMKAAGESPSGALPEWLHRTMAEAAGGALDQLAEMDLETLRKLLPDDQAMLRSLVDQVAGAAESMARKGALPSPPTGMPKVTAETKQRLEQLAQGLKGKLGGLLESGESRSGESAPRGKPSRDGSPSGVSRSAAGAQASNGQLANGEPSRGSSANGSPAGGGGAGEGSSGRGSAGRSSRGRRSANRSDDSGAAPARVAALLDLTASSRRQSPADLATRPARPAQPGSTGATTPSSAPSTTPSPLPREWQPTGSRKAVPTIAGGAPAPDPSARVPSAAGGSDTPAGSGRSAANWQQRLLPRHRAIVRRFFGERRE
ncbi:MAG: hypothetical protein AB8H80_08015 [Planctomycetota bacterium]